MGPVLSLETRESIFQNGEIRETDEMGGHGLGVSCPPILHAISFCHETLSHLMIWMDKIKQYF
jgi:hypothetical protein